LTAEIFVLSFLEPLIFKNDLGYLLRLLSPFMFVFTFGYCLETIFSGNNQIYYLSIFRLAPSIIYLVTALFFNYFVFSLSLFAALLIQLISMGCVVIFFVLKIRPSVMHLKKNISMLWFANKTHGLQSYFGSICGVATAHFAGLALGFYSNTQAVGFFYLAFSITMPLTLIPTTVGTVFYKEFVNSSSIPLKATILTIVISSLSLMIFLLLIEKLVILLYPVEFISIVPIAYILAIASSIHGFGDYFNRYIGAHGKGLFNRNGAILVGISNILGYFLLIRWFGIYGAAVTKVLSAIMYLSIMFYYYRQTLLSIKNDHRGIE
jgi:O-antigen/teichoic acid export membrane protein